MKKKVVVAIVAASILVGSAGAEVRISENSDTRVITASGSIDGTKMTNLISLNVNNAEGSEVYSASIPTADGKINYSFKLPDVSGIYTMSFTAYEGDPTVIEYEYISQSDIDAILLGINTAADDAAVTEVLKMYRGALGLDGKWYGLLSDAGKKALAQDIIAGKTDGRTQYSSLEEIKTIAREKLAMLTIDAAANGNAIVEAYAEFNDIYQLDTQTKLYEEYIQLSDVAKKSAGDLVAAANISTKQDLYSIFDEAAFITIFNTTPREPIEMTNLIDTYASNFSYLDKNGNAVTLADTRYSASNKTLTANYLYARKGNYTSIKNLFEMIDAAYNDQNKSVGTVGSGGGSSSSSSKNDKGNTINISPGTKVINADVFEDLGSVEWAKTAILYLKDKGIVSGVADKQFEPQGTVTREQFIVMLVNAFNLTDSAAASDFEDMPADHWAYSAVSSAYAKAVVKGVGEGKFGTGENIRRCDMAVMAVKAAKLVGINFDVSKNVSFNDAADIPDYAKESVEIMAAAGIINGYEDGTFKPFNNATRAEAAQIIYTIIK